MSQREFIIIVDELASHSRLAISASYVALSLLHALKPQGARVRLVNRSGFTPAHSKRSYATTLNRANLARLAQIGLSEAAWFGEAKALPSYGSSLWMNNIERGYLSDAKTGVSINGVSFAQLWRQAQRSQSQQPPSKSYDHYCLAKRLAVQGLFQKPTSDQRQIQSTLAYDLHLDTGMLQSILIKRFQLLGGLISTVEPKMPIQDMGSLKKIHHDSLPPFLIDFTESKILTQQKFSPQALIQKPLTPNSLTPKNLAQKSTPTPATSTSVEPRVGLVRMELVPGENYAMRDNAVHFNAHAIRSERVLAHGLVRLTGFSNQSVDTQTQAVVTTNNEAKTEIGERYVHWHEDEPASEHRLELGHFLSSFDDLWIDPLAVSEAVLSDTLSTLNQALAFSGASLVNRRAAVYRKELAQFSQLALTLVQENDTAATNIHTPISPNALTHLQQLFQHTGRIAQAERYFISEQKYLSLLMAKEKLAASNVKLPDSKSAEPLCAEREENGTDLVNALQRLEQILDSTLEHAIRQQNDLLNGNCQRTRVGL